MNKGEDINFGDNLTMTVFIEGLKSVQLVLSDDLNASEEELTIITKIELLDFLMNGIVGMALRLEPQKSMSPKGMMLRTSKIWISN